MEVPPIPYLVLNDFMANYPGDDVYASKTRMLGSTILRKDGVSAKDISKIIENGDQLTVQPLICGGKRKNKKALAMTGDVRKQANDIRNRVAKLTQNMGTGAASRNMIVGAGDYNFGKALGGFLKGVVKKGVAEAGSVLGGAAAASMGVPPEIGMALGGSAGNKLSRIIGSGDYTVAAPTAVNSLIRGANENSTLGKGATTFAHREFIGNISSPATCGGFSIQGFPVNVGLAGTFPYLSKFAANFEQYKLKGLAFEFVSSTSAYNASSAMGTIIFAMEYNATAAPYADKQSMENSDFAISTRFDKCMVYGVECKDQAQGQFYVRTVDQTSLTPLNLTDIGVFYVATSTASTFPTDSIIGELWVTYHVELSKPIFTSPSYGYARLSTISNNSFSPSTVKAPLLANNSGTNVNNYVEPIGRGSLILSDIREAPLYLFENQVAYAPSVSGQASLVSLFNAKIGDVFLLTFTASIVTAAAIDVNLLVSTNSTGSLEVDDRCVLLPDVMSNVSGSPTAPVGNLISYTTVSEQSPGYLTQIIFSAYVRVRVNSVSEGHPVLYLYYDVGSFTPSAYASNIVLTFVGSNGQSF
jgi:hypothetical protein